MDLKDIIKETTPTPWLEGDNIPWNEPGFSERMLREHLSQEHDAASRRFTSVDQHIQWIHTELMNGIPGRVLDLGCGPGLYSNRLAQRGHMCHGIDYSPASIRFARQTAARDRLSCTYQQEDIRRADYGTGYDLVMMIYGEFNVFKPADASLVLNKASQALKLGGKILLEVHTFEAVKELGSGDGEWSAMETGLFFTGAHLLLERGYWDEAQQAATRRYYVIEGESGRVIRYAVSYQGYRDQEYVSLLEKHGFAGVQILGGMGSGVFPGLQILTGIHGNG